MTEPDLSTPNLTHPSTPPLPTDTDQAHSSDTCSDNTTTNTSHTKINSSPCGSSYTYDAYNTTTTIPLPEQHHTLETLRNSTPLYPLTLHLHDTPFSTGHNSDPHSDYESHTDADDIEPYITSTHTTDTPTNTTTSTNSNITTTNSTNKNSHIYTWIQRMTSHLHISTPTHIPTPTLGQGVTMGVTKSARQSYGSSGCSGTAGTDDSGSDSSSSSNNGGGVGGGDGCTSKVESSSSSSPLQALLSPPYAHTHGTHPATTTIAEKATTTTSDRNNNNSGIYTHNASSSTPMTSAAAAGTSTDLTAPSPTLTAEQYIYYGEVRSLHIPYLYLLFTHSVYYIIHPTRTLSILYIPSIYFIIPYYAL